MFELDNKRILVIDDNESIHLDYRKVLAGPSDNGLDELESLMFGDSNDSKPEALPSYQIDSAYQGKDGFEMVKNALESGEPYALACVDVRMPPGWDGVETAQRIWEVAPELPIILCTAYSDHSWSEITERLDRSDQLLILKKPFDNVELRQMVALQTEKWRLTKIANLKQAELEQRVQQRTQDVLATRDTLFFTLARLVESRDLETSDHLNRMQQYTHILALWLMDHGPYQDQVDEKFVDDIHRSSILHDIGKVGIPDDVLLKPGRLTPDEFEVMKQHAVIGADALDEALASSECCSFLKMSAEIARYHHERFDGSGYPEGIDGQAIPLSARITAVADVFDAITSDRRYRKAMDKLDAKELINADSGRHFDPVIVEAFNACWEQIRDLHVPAMPARSCVVSNTEPVPVA